MFNLLFFSVLYRQIFFLSTTLAIGTLFKTEQIRQFHIKNDIKKWRFCFFIAIFAICSLQCATHMPKGGEEEKSNKPILKNKL